MYYIKTKDLRVIAVFKDMDEGFLAGLDSHNADGLRAAFAKNIEGATRLEALPENFDWRHISRYSLSANNELIDNGWEEPPREQTTEELLLEISGDHEYRLCLMELGVTEDDLQTV